MGEYRKAVARAFPYTIPVFAGYLFIGAAFGVMFADQGYNVLWAILMSVVVYAGSGQYLATNFFVPCTTDVPDDVDEEKFLLSITLLNQFYWILGTIIGSVAFTVISFDSTGIEFAMTALFIVMFMELWYRRTNRPAELIGMVSAVLCLALFGAENFVLPTMVLMVAVILLGKKKLHREEAEADA